MSGAWKPGAFVLEEKLGLRIQPRYKLDSHSPQASSASVLSASLGGVYCSVEGP